MTALADQLCAYGIFPNPTVADAAITAGQVYKDGNGQVRVAGCRRAVVADITAASQVTSLTSEPGGHTKTKGSGSNKW